MKKRVGFVTNYPNLKTGFATNIKALLPFLENTGKYELFLLAAGLPENNPDYNRFPWKTDGAMQNFDPERMRNPQEEGYRRFVSYGNSAVENWAIKNKLDVIFHIEDIWSSAEEAYLKRDWYKFVKKNFVQWTTADSEPILPNFKTWAENCPNMWFWTSFAERWLKREDPKKYSHVKTVHGTLDASIYRPLSKEEKSELRKLYKIEDDCKIFIMLSRNQLRKLWFSNLEALKKFKALYPKDKIKLLFWTGMHEGWPLQRTMEELKINKNDVLFGYVCQHCLQFEIKPYDGENKDCPFCGVKGSPPSQKTPNGTGQLTPRVDLGIPESELYKVYGIADACSHQATSGGLEYVCLSSLLCGLPLTTPNYSYGEEFCANDFVYPTEHTFTRECGSDFKKVVPHTDSIVKFFKKIYDMPEVERLEIGKKGREWAIKEFDIAVIGKVVENFIDTCQPLDWSKYKAEGYKPKNDSFPFEDKGTNIEFLVSLYKNILFMDFEDGPEKEGCKYWLKALEAGWTRRQVYDYFANEAKKENQSNTKVDIWTLFDTKRPNKRALVMIKESRGDCLYISGLFKSLKERYPDTDLYIMTEQQYFDMFDLNPYIHKVLPYIPQFENELFAIGAGQEKGYVDYFFHPAVMTQRHLNYLSNSKPILPK